MLLEMLRPKQWGQEAFRINGRCKEGTIQDKGYTYNTRMQKPKQTLKLKIKNKIK
jgi:hypothetical protein